HDPMIKSHLLYQLSHGVIMFAGEGWCFSRFASAKLLSFFYMTKFFAVFFHKKRFLFEFGSGLTKF
ncbi:MAG: hypothetical protein K2H15_01335, partial [Muribaculaceae bacterium]|nr:hypothetical protein [Muribaculaceae bacterium]